MNKLFALIEREDIYLEYVDLISKTKRRLFGLYINGDTCGPMILIDISLDKPEKRRMHRCVLAEEIGHHFTSPRTNCLTIQGSCSLGINNMNAKIQMAQDEFKALEWATLFLIPNVEFSRAIEEGYQTVSELADRFDVTEWFIYRKIGILKAKYRKMGFKTHSRDYLKIRPL